MSCTKGDLVRLSVERMTYGADAIAHSDDGKTVFVSGALAGDVVEARITRCEKSYSKAVATTILEPSEDRTQAPCPYAAVCGGCPWAALKRPAQLQAKRDNVLDALTRIGHMDKAIAGELVADCESPGNDWGYRNKVELGFSRSGRKTIIGMHTTSSESGKPQLIKVDACPLFSSRHKKAVKSVSGALTYLAGSSGIDLMRVGIRASERTKDIEVALWTSPGSFPRAKVAKVLSDATKATSTVRVLLKGSEKARKVTGVEVLGGKGYWRERISNNAMALSAPSFFQVNTVGAERLVELVIAGLDPHEDDVAMDLYCGAGTFTLPLAKRCSWVSAVESYGPAVRDLRRNLQSLRLDNVEPIGGDADREFPDDDADIIVVDPPRAGLAPDVVKKLSEQPARAIAYVSCDPATLARDLRRFEEEGVFTPERITPVDLFPQTFHVETVTILRHV